jgi:tetratricopeptide (TPR) repeat protein
LERRAIAYELGKQWPHAERDWSTLVRLTQEENGKYLARRGECYLHMGRRNDAFRDFSKAVNRTASADTIQRIASLLGLAESLVPIRSSWLYRTGTAPEADWETLSFDDSQWQTGWAPFGARQSYLPTRTDTSFYDVWLRKTFDLDRDIDSRLVLRMRVEGDVEVFINGVSAAPASTFPNYMDDLQLSNLQGSRYLRMYPVVPCSSQVRLRKGKNVLAVHCRNPKQSRSYVDIGLYVSNGDVDIPSMLSTITDRVPDNPYLHTALALRFVEQQRWEDAAVQFHTSARILGEDTLPKWMWAALMYRLSGDLNRYRELTTEIIDRFKSEESAERLSGVVKACLLAEPSIENLSGLVEMADRAVQFDPNNASAQIAKALAAYWSQDFEDANRWAHRCGDDNRQASCVLALANAASGQIELARQQAARLQQGSDGFHIQVSLKRQDAAHEAAFFNILLEEVKRTLSLE